MFFCHRLVPLVKHPILALLLQMRNGIFDHRKGQYIEGSWPVCRRLLPWSRINPVLPQVPSTRAFAHPRIFWQHISFSVAKVAPAGLNKYGTPIVNQAKLRKVGISSLLSMEKKWVAGSSGADVSGLAPPPCLISPRCRAGSSGNSARPPQKPHRNNAHQ